MRGRRRLAIITLMLLVAAIAVIGTAQAQGRSPVDHPDRGRRGPRTRRPRRHRHGHPDRQPGAGPDLL